MSSRNEAAERLRNGLYWNDGTDDYAHDIDEALAAERRATVERIRAALDADSFYGSYKTPRGRLNAILDEVANAQEEAAK